MSKKKPLTCCCVEQLSKPEAKPEARFYRDRLRDARYAALADAEGFGQLCFAIELLGSRLCGAKIGLGQYEKCLKCLAANALNADQFDALYRRVMDARNDAMHTGAYARNAAQAAVQLSLILEEGLMNKNDLTVADCMVTTPVYVEGWHTLGYARQLMLVNSFSYLPIFHGDKWHLISDMAMAQFFQRLENSEEKKEFEAKPIKVVLPPLDASPAPLRLLALIPVDNPRVRSTPLTELLSGDAHPHPGLWLVVNAKDGEGLKQLVGVLSPFELM